MAAAGEPALETLSDRARALLQGALDIHVHADPDPDAAHKLDFRETVARAREAGLAGLVLKSHEYPTQPLAWALDREFSGIDVYGGVALDWGVGGAEPRGGGDHAAHRGAGGMDADVRRAALAGLAAGAAGTARRRASPCWTGEGVLLPVCHDILDVIAGHDAVLASCHLSPDETAALLGEGLARGVRCVITHASFWTPVDLQQEIAAKDGFIEQCAISVADGEEAWPDLLEQVRTVRAGTRDPLLRPRAGGEPGAGGGAGALRRALSGGGVQRGGGGDDAACEPGRTSFRIAFGFPPERQRARFSQTRAGRAAS